MMLPIPAAGTLAAVDGQDDARAVPGVVGLEITIAPGRPVQPLPEGDRYLGLRLRPGARRARRGRGTRCGPAHACLDIVLA